ncbi:MAG TPA: ATP-dependent helicase HrpB [Gammaproteobacteria bacterium]|nr:ATP-dependent helicase HrpB [Gammaproteobacteria bacterium]
MTLPIDQALPALRDALAAQRSAVLQAPPGAGKSTVVPLALLEESWARDKRIVMLEPRRLAARAVARRMAQTLGEAVGQTVGYRMRLDTRVSPATRIEVVTEGVLTRRLQTDPELEGVALVIFDEFHERSLQADLGLALTLDAREALAPELRVLVMSATLEAEPVARLLGDAAIVKAEGRAFPVESRFTGKGLPLLPGWLGRNRGGTSGAASSPEQLTVRIVRHALGETEGDLLVFLPGVREIRGVRTLLEAAGLEPNVHVLSLFGDLEAKAQDAVLAPAPAGERKIVLATNVAETSLTIEGVRVVVDSGLVRRLRFDPSTGMGRLETQRISRASAEQRQGRAGRTAPGVCYRAWSESAHASLPAVSPPEILSADLAPLALELASWGVAEANDLRWLDPPPAAMLASARDLLRRLGALDPAGRITPHGQEMAQLAVHPRLAHMLLAARGLGCLRLAAEIAALLGARDLLRGAAARDADMRTRLELLRGSAQRGEEKRAPGASDRQRASTDRRGADGQAVSVDRGALIRAKRLADEIERQLAERPASMREREERRQQTLQPDRFAGVLLAFAYPDRIGRRRPDGSPRYTLTNGRGAELPEGQSLGREAFIVAIDVDDSDRDARILLAAPLTRSDIEAHFADRLAQAEEVEWNPREQAVTARRSLRLDGLLIDQKPLLPIPAEAALNAMLAGVHSLGLQALPWTQEVRELQARVEFLRGLSAAEAAEWPALDDASLEASLGAWLAPWLDGITRREHLARLPLLDALRALIGWEKQGRLEALAPQRLEVPSGSRIRIDYRDENAPVVAVRLQEVFGLEETPRIAGGRVPVTFKLLSPAQRPVQITRDLASFWRSGYAEVRKNLRGRYPKHYWPENPREAQAVRGVRPRG